MTKRLEEEFNLPPMEEVTEKKETKKELEEDSEQTPVINIDDALSVGDKINAAFNQIKKLDIHEAEMDNIIEKALHSYDEYSSLGKNVSDMAAGKVLSEAANMLKIAMEASDLKVKAKLQQIDLMIKKARLDKDAGKMDQRSNNAIIDRNDLLQQIKKKDK